MSMLPGPLAIAPHTDQIEEEGANPDEIRKMSESGDHPGIRQRLWGIENRLDPTVTFEEFTYWAKIERDLEAEDNRRYLAANGGSGGMTGTLLTLFGKKSKMSIEAIEENSRVEQTYEESTKHIEPKSDNNEKSISKKDDGATPIPPPPAYGGELETEWRKASRAMRTASWGGVFYLITTDILGWSQTPYVFASVGYGMGVGIFILMGLAAGLSGWMIWRIFLALDSSRYPVLSFGDPFYRLYGSWMRHFINVAQALQMFLSVAVVLLGQTSLIAQLGGSVNLCYVVCAIIGLVVSMASGYMRSLKQLGWFCNAAVWINVISFIIICVCAAKFGPDPTAAVNNGVLPSSWAFPATMAPVRTFANAPPAEYQQTDHNLFAAKFNGINSMVYAYSGALLFIAFLSEMRHPMDFWKAVLLAQTFITVVYIFFGAFVYSYFGQYSYSSITQSIKPESLQILNNVFSLITGWLAVFLYGNVGMKTVYVEVFEQLLSFPPIASNKGKYIWWAMFPVYWIIAFVVCMSIPQFSAFTNFVGGLFSLNFTYSFSGVMFIAYLIHEGARQPGEGFDPITRTTIRHDGGYKRILRGFLKSWKWSVPTLIYTLLGFAASGMGTWAAVLALQSAFGPGGSVTTSWSCANPFYTG